jgi:hypothetical protein
MSLRLSRFTLSVLILVSALHISSADSAETCNSDGEYRFVCGTTNPEDLYQLPGTSWVIASGRISDSAGPIYAVNSNDFSVEEIFPSNALAPEFDRSIYRDCPGPNLVFQPHGLTLREGDGGKHTLYVVGHGAREAIEVFEIDANDNIPSLKWIGCIPSPEGTRRVNSITTLPGGYLGATNFDTSGGELWEWHHDTAWIEVPGSQMPGPNGLVSSADGDWYYIGGWSDKALVRLSRGRSSIQIDTAPVGFSVDNVRWGKDGNIVVAGHVSRCPNSSPCELSAARVALVNPATLSVQQIVNYKGNDFFRLGTVAIEFENEIWIGGINGSMGIARIPQ